MIGDKLVDAVIQIGANEDDDVVYTGDEYTVISEESTKTDCQAEFTGLECSDVEIGAGNQD